MVQRELFHVLLEHRVHHAHRVVRDVAGPATPLAQGGHVDLRFDDGLVVARVLGQHLAAWIDDQRTAAAPGVRAAGREGDVGHRRIEVVEAGDGLDIDLVEQGGGAEHDLHPAHRIGGKHHRIVLHRAHRDVAELGAQHREQLFFAVAGDVAVVDVLDGGGGDLDVAVVLDVARLPELLGHLAVTPDHGIEAEDVARPVGLVAGVAAEDDVGVALFGQLAQRVGFRPRDGDGGLELLLAWAIGVSGQRELVEQDEIRLLALAAGTPGQVRHLLQVVGQAFLDAGEVLQVARQVLHDLDHHLVLLQRDLGIAAILLDQGGRVRAGGGKRDGQGQQLQWGGCQGFQSGHVDRLVKRGQGRGGSRAPGERPARPDRVAPLRPPGSPGRRVRRR